MQATGDPVDDDGPSRAIITDLTLGAWSPRHAAAELYEQLGIAGAPADPPQANAINRGVDREAQGDGMLLAAYAAAGRIADRLPRDGVVVVQRPRQGLPVRADNRALLRYLRALGVTVRVVGTPAVPTLAALPPLLRLYPGLVPDAVIAACGVAADHPALRRVAGGRLLIDPAARTLDPRGHKPLIDRLAAFEPHDPRLFGWYQAMGSPAFVDVAALAAYAQAAVATSPDLALALADHARAAARDPLTAATAELHRQGIRIFLHRFADAAAAPAPAPALPAALRAELGILRGWGKVMLGEIDEADRCFAIGAEARDCRDDTDSLYRRNIVALARFRAGDIAGAIALEASIEAALARDDDPDPQLAFVNAINLARLHRAAGDLGEHRRYLALACATSDNVRSPSEMLQLNLLLARALAEIDAVGAARAVVRAALVWLVAEPPEALGVRAARVIAGAEHAHPRRLDAIVARDLEARLAAAWPGIEPGAGPLPQVALSDQLPGLAAADLIAVEGLCLVRADAAPRRLARDPAVHALADRVFAIVGALTGIGEREHGAWIIDAATGADIRADADAAAATAWRHGLGACDTGGLVLTRGPAVRRIERGGRRIVFRRHLPPLDLDPGDAALVDAVLAGDPPPAGVRPDPRIAALVERRVLGVRRAA